MNQLTPEESLAVRRMARDIRVDILKMITQAQSGHTGGSLSIADLMALLFFMK